MAELSPTERLQPCLLDRLTDQQPAAAVEGRDQRVMSLRQIRASVLRDLGWLLNTAQRLSAEEAPDTPDVLTSVVNYGVPDLAGVTPSDLNLAKLEREVERAILAYEPRILPDTLRVRAIVDHRSMSSAALSFEIRGDLWSQPVPDPLYLKTELDLETGVVRVEEKTRG